MSQLEAKTSNNINSLDEIPNIHRVDKNVWKNWSRMSRKVFNDIYDSVLRDWSLFLHPEAPGEMRVLRGEKLRTLAHNLAWTTVFGIENYLNQMNPPKETKDIPEFTNYSQTYDYYDDVALENHLSYYNSETTVSPTINNSLGMIYAQNR